MTVKNKYKIDAVLNELQRIWNRNSELSLGKLLSNAILVSELDYLEDEELIEKLREYYK